MDKTVFRKELEKLVNKHSMESGSDTPDFILADYLVGCLNSYDIALKAREKWYGREKQPLSADQCPCGEVPLIPYANIPSSSGLSSVNEKP